MGRAIDPKHEYEIYKNVDSYAKIYPSMTKLFVLNHTTKLRIAGFEPRKRTEHMHSETHDPVAAIDSMRRTKTRLRDLVISNQFELFCTFTFKEDRFDVDKCKTQMSRWLHNQQTRTGKFDYLIVPEYHKRCEPCVDAKAKECLHDDRPKAIHFHAMVKGYMGALPYACYDTPKGANYCNTDHKHRLIFHNDKPVHNIKGYNLGFTNVTYIQDVDKTANYIGKYITKDMPQFHGKKRYWCSHGLERPIKVTNPVIFPSDMAKFGQEIHMNQNFKLYIADQKVVMVSEWGL
jgi:hypothetical protein